MRIKTDLLDLVVETLPLLGDEPENVLVRLVAVEVLDLVLDLVLELKVGRHGPLGGVGVLERAFPLLLAVVVVAATGVGRERLAGGEHLEERTQVGRVGEGRGIGKGLDGVGARAHGLADLDERVDHLQGRGGKVVSMA